jgi:hypothetical protein
LSESFAAVVLRTSATDSSDAAGRINCSDSRISSSSAPLRASHNGDRGSTIASIPMTTAIK